MIDFIECVDEQFKCNNGKCIMGVRYCDEVSDCLDGSDEPPGCSKFQQICLHQKQVLHTSTFAQSIVNTISQEYHKQYLTDMST